MGRAVLASRRGAGNCTSSRSPAQSQRRRVFIIGIAGPSGAGKSTLAQKLVKVLHSPLKPIGMDWYLQPKWMPKDPEHGKNWETPDGVDWGMLRRDLQYLGDTLAMAESVPDELQVTPDEADVVAYKQAGKSLGAAHEAVVIIVEGFLLFYDEALAKMLDAQLWIQSDYDTCLQRRHQRGKASRKKEVETSAEWFRSLVWEYYQRYRKVQLWNVPDALRLDGCKEKDEIMEEAVAHCQKLLDAGESWGRGWEQPHADENARISSWEKSSSRTRACSRRRSSSRCWGDRACKRRRSQKEWNDNDVYPRDGTVVLVPANRCNRPARRNDSRKRRRFSSRSCSNDRRPYL